MRELRERLSHVLWIGGGTDAGKTSVARALAERYRLPVYHFDRADLRHHQRLAETSPDYAAFLAMSMHERWIQPTPEALAARALQSFRDRFPLVVEELPALAVADSPQVLAEGFGLTPELVAPVLTHPRQAIWLVPTDAFKRASMERRRKGEFGGAAGDAARMAENLLARDRLLTKRVRAEAQRYDLHVVEVDGSAGIEAMAARIAAHFGLRDVPTPRH